MLTSIIFEYRRIYILQVLAIFLLCNADINLLRNIDNKLISDIRRLILTCDKEKHPNLFNSLQTFLCKFDGQYFLNQERQNFPLEKVNSAHLTETNLEEFKSIVCHTNMNYEFLRSLKIIHSLHRKSESVQERTVIMRLIQNMENILKNVLSKKSIETSFESYLNELIEHNLNYKQIIMSSSNGTKTEIRKLFDEIASNINKLKEIMNFTHTNMQYITDINKTIKLLENLKH